MWTLGQFDKLSISLRRPYSRISEINIIEKNLLDRRHSWQKNIVDKNVIITIQEQLSCAEM